MKKTKTIITIKAWKRPGYYAEVIAGLADCIDRSENKDYKVIISLDNAPQELTEQMVKITEDSNIAHLCHIFVNKHSLGCAGNTYFLMEQAFDQHHADHVIHLEDDTVPAKDFLQYMDWAYHIMKDNYTYFACCPFNRGSVEEFIPKGTMASSYQKAWFEASGGFGMPRRTWDFIKSKGGMFGTVRTRETHDNNPDLVGQAWKDRMHITWQGSWMWAFNQYFRERSHSEHLCIFPTVSRTQNIGAVDGAFNPSPEWHAGYMKGKFWIDDYPVVENVEYALNTEEILLPINIA